MSEHGVRTRLWRNGTVEADNFPFSRISDYLEEPDCLVWVDVCAPDAARLTALADELSLDPHAIEDAVEHRERPRHAQEDHACGGSSCVGVPRRQHAQEDPGRRDALSVAR